MEEQTQFRRQQTQGMNRYEKFKKQNRSFWLVFNLIAIVLSVACAVGTFLILFSDEERCLLASLNIALALVLSLHVVNTIEFLLNLTGLEVWCCNGTVMCGYFIFELTILIYMQVIYFQA